MLALNSESKLGRILTWYYLGATNGSVSHEQGPSHHPEKGPGSLGHYTRQQSGVRRRWRWCATQASQKTCFFTHRRGSGHSRLQGSSDSSGQDAWRAGNEEGGEACAPLTPTSLRAFISATMRRRGVSPQVCCQQVTYLSRRR